MPHTNHTNTTSRIFENRAVDEKNGKKYSRAKNMKNISCVTLERRLRFLWICIISTWMLTLIQYIYIDIYLSFLFIFFKLYSLLFVFILSFVQFPFILKYNILSYNEYPENIFLYIYMSLFENLML